jgi:hypothetical protein
MRSDCGPAGVGRPPAQVVHREIVMCFRVSAIIVAMLLSIISTPSRAAGLLGDGEVLGPDSWEQARNLLPDEILDHYRTGDYRNRIMDVERPGYRTLRNPPPFEEASRTNRGRFDLTAAGSIIERATGQPPEHIFGLPFPEIEPSDPEAARKVMWNYFYYTWYGGDRHMVTEFVMLGTRGVERRITTDVYMRMYDGSPESRGRTNPENIALQTLALVTSPADLNGTVSLTWRYRDATKSDSTWSYVPGLRRARQVNPLNRSDGFLGSDISLDDGTFFDGKPESFDVRLIGKQDQLVLIDPFSVRGEAELIALPGGGVRTVFKDVPRIGADDPQWKGLPWAPVSAVLVRRPVWVVEAKPKDRNYLYGRLVLRFDAETYHGTWASKYDRAGKIAMSYQVANGAFYTLDDGKTYSLGGGIAVQTAENFVYRRATAVVFPPRDPENPTDLRVPTSGTQFSPDILARRGE